MKFVVIGAHRERNDIEPLAAAIAVSDLWLSGMAVEESQPLGDRDLLVRVAKTRAALLDRATFLLPVRLVQRQAAHAKLWPEPC